MYTVIIVEDVKLELKGTEEIFRNEIPEAQVIGTAMSEEEFWPLMERQMPDMVLLDLGWITRFWSIKGPQQWWWRNS